MSSPNNCLNITRNLLDEYNPNLSPAHYIQNIKFLQDDSVFDYEKNFVCEVFYGCCDKEKSLNIVLDGYYAKEGHSCLKSERNYYKIYAFICLYRLDDYGMDELKFMATLWNQEKTLKFLKFISLERNLLTWMKSAWCNLYSPDFVNQKLIVPFQRKIPELEDFLSTLESKVYTVGTKKNKKATEVEPFNLKTQEIVHKVLVPEKIAVPPKRERKTLSASEIRLQQKKFDELQKSVQPKYKIRTKPIAKEEDEDASEKIAVAHFKASPFKLTQNSASVKLNTAVVLREEHVIKKQTESILKKFDYLENGDRNEDEFTNWQQEMKLNDLRQEIEESEKKKLLSKISHENAKLAKEDDILKNKMIGREVQSQKDLLNKIRSEKRTEEYQMNRQNAENIKEYEKYVMSTVKEEVVNKKKAIAQEVAKESEELQARAYREAELEMAKKIELIQQIKAAESISVDRTKPVDLTSTAGHQLLSEMSIVELHERLELAKQENEKQKMQIHDSIIKGKVEKEQNIVQKLHYINKFRNENAILEKKMKNVSVNDLREAIKKDLAEKNPTIQSLKNKLNSSKAETKMIDKTFKRKTNNLTTYADQRKILEWERLKDIEKKIERNASVV